MSSVSFSQSISVTVIWAGSSVGIKTIRRRNVILDSEEGGPHESRIKMLWCRIKRNTKKTVKRQQPLDRNPFSLLAFFSSSSHSCVCMHFSPVSWLDHHHLPRLLVLHFFTPTGKEDKRLWDSWMAWIKDFEAGIEGKEIEDWRSRRELKNSLREWHYLLSPPSFFREWHSRGSRQRKRWSSRRTTWEERADQEKTKKRWRRKRIMT